VTLTYAQAHDLLEALVRARMAYDGDAWVALFADDAEVSLDPFGTPLAGPNDLRAYLNAAAEAERWFDVQVERHWVAGDAALAAWHASWTRRSDEAKVRQSGFLVAETGGDTRIQRLRQWTVTREHPAGQEGTG
jgi:ketosteroid isomerase-like protein